MKNYIELIEGDDDKEIGLFYEIGYNMNLAAPIMLCPEQDEKDAIIKYIEDSKIEFPTFLKEFYLQLTEVDLEWRFDKEDHEIEVNYLMSDERLTGMMKIKYLHLLMDGLENKKWEGVLWFDSMDNELKTKMQKYRLFDQSIPELMICLKVEDNVMEDMVYYHSMYSDEPVEMGLTIEEYMDIALKVKCYQWWQKAYMDKTCDECKRMKHYLPQLFPNLKFDFSDFE